MFWGPQMEPRASPSDPGRCHRSMQTCSAFAKKKQASHRHDTVGPIGSCSRMAYLMQGGNRYFEGLMGFLEIPEVQNMGFPQIHIIHADQQKSKNLICQKYQDFTTFLVHGQMVHTFTKIYLISLGVACDFSFCKNNGFVKIMPRKKTQNPISRQDFLKRVPEMWHKNMESSGSKNIKQIRIPESWDVSR